MRGKHTERREGTGGEIDRLCKEKESEKERGPSSRHIGSVVRGSSEEKRVVRTEKREKELTGRQSEEVRKVWRGKKYAVSGDLKGKTAYKKNTASGVPSWGTERIWAAGCSRGASLSPAEQ